jgi:hypothetical protein
MTNLITRARKEWCERYFAMTRFSGERHIEADPPLFACPPEVVAALLGVLAWAKTEDCAPYANRDCDCCTALGKIEDAITRALEQKP